MTPGGNSGPSRRRGVNRRTRTSYRGLSRLLSPARVGLAAGVVVLTGIGGATLTMGDARDSRPSNIAATPRPTLPQQNPPRIEAKAPRLPTATRSTKTRIPAAATKKPTASAKPPADGRLDNSTAKPLSGGFTGKTVTEQWAQSSSPLFRKVVHNGSTVVGGRSDTAASDRKALNLTIPAGAQAGPGRSAEVESATSYLYGSFESRVRSADCSGQPRTGAVTGIFTYGNDGRDHDKDGIIDNSELDVEILCARPDILNLTIWTDYDESNNAQQRVTRVINLKSGKVLSTCYQTSFDGPCQAVSRAEKEPATVQKIAGFDSAKNYHDYRIDWSADRVVFTVNDDSKSITLWDYRGPSSRIPHRTSQYMVNLWHTNDWTPEGADSATASPDAALTAAVDSTRITPAS